MKEHFLELIRRAAVELPTDVTLALKKAAKAEAESSPARAALQDILGNCQLAEKTSRPLCQDTGANIWYVNYRRKF